MTAKRSPRRAAAAAIELEIAGVAVRVGNAARASTVTAVIRALKKFTCGPSGIIRVMVATKPVDFRNGAAGLAALVPKNMHTEPHGYLAHVTTRIVNDHP
jgi:hypothetical protein